MTQEYKYFDSVTRILVEPSGDGWRVETTMTQKRSVDGETYEEKVVRVADFGKDLKQTSFNVETEVMYIIKQCKGNLFLLAEEEINNKKLL
jgi:hypothetical protein